MTKAHDTETHEAYEAGETDTQSDLVARLKAAHRATVRQTKMLTKSRQLRRDLAVELHQAGHSYRWIGAQIGLTAQAVEGFVKYQQRRAARSEPSEPED